MNSIKKFILVLRTLRLNNYLILISFFNLIYALLEVLSLAMIIPLINFIVNPDAYLNILNSSKFTLFQNLGNYFSSITQFQIIKLVTLSILIIFIFKFIYSIFFEWFKAKFIYKIEYNLSNTLFTKYITSGYKYILDKNTAELHRNILGDINQFNGTAQSLINFFTDIIFSFGIILLLMITNFNITLILISAVLLFGYLIFRFTSKINFKLGKDVSDATEKKINIMIQSFAGIKEIIIYNSSDFFKNLFNIENKKLSKAKQNNSVIIALPKLLIELLIFISFIILILFLFYFNYDVKELIAKLSFLAIAMIRITPSSYRIVVSLQRIKFTEVPIENIFNKINQTKINESKVKNSCKIQSFKKIKFESVFFQFNDKKKIFSDLNLEINCNNTIGIYGKSGSGKTTFINLISGLFLPNKGEIFIDEFNMRENLNNWRSLIGFVPQNVFILNDSLKKNIAFGFDNENINHQLLNKSITLSGLTDFVENSDFGIDTNLGENGSKISGGQRQRVGIARALYKNSKILIFDEATNSLDLNTEKEVISNIYDLKNKLTIVIISHNKNIIDQCDIKYKLENLNLVKAK